MATECGKLNHRHVTDDISDSAADVVTSPRGHSVTSPSTRKSTVSGQLSVFVYCIYVSSAACGPVAMKAKLYWVTDALPEAIVPGSDSSSIRLLWIWETDIPPLDIPSGHFPLKNDYPDISPHHLTAWDIPVKQSGTQGTRKTSATRLHKQCNSSYGFWVTVRITVSIFLIFQLQLLLQLTFLPFFSCNYS